MIQKTTGFLEASRGLSGLLGTLSGSAYGAFFEQYKGEMEGRDGFLSQLTVFYAPDPIGHNLVIDRAPYANPKSIKESYAGSVERGWIVETSPGAFEASDKARDFFKAIYEVDDQVFIDLKENFSGDLTLLLKFFDAVLENINKTDVIDKKDAFDQAMKFRSNVVYISDLHDLRDKLQEVLSYRDDVHVASWRPHNLEGYVWEAFSSVWEDTAQTAAELVENRPFRQYDESEYQGALNELKERGWLSEENGKFEITDEGKSVRQKTEDLTDQYFVAGFTGMDEQEVEQAIELLNQLKEELQPEPEPQT